MADHELVKWDQCDCHSILDPDVMYVNKSSNSIKLWLGNISVVCKTKWQLHKLYLASGLTAITDELLDLGMWNLLQK